LRKFVGLLIFTAILTFGANCQTQTRPSSEDNTKSTSLTEGGFPIIPGRTGFGLYTPAGSGPKRSGGKILIVTTLEDSGPGSLREALLTDEPRVVLFNISGNIRLKSAIKITSPYLTVAGQTAPSPGISIVNAGLEISTHDVLIQHIRIRVGDADEGPKPIERDGISINPPSHTKDRIYNVVIDHLSICWAIDENLSLFHGSSNDGIYDVTISNSIISEALSDSKHPKGPHSKGMLVGWGTHNLLVQGNLFAHNDQRNMKVHGNTGTVFVNNLIYNWRGSSPQGGASVYGSEYGPYFASIVGNVYVKGRDRRHPNESGNRSIPVNITGKTAEGSKIFLKDNRAHETTKDPWTVALVEAKHPVKSFAPPLWPPSLKAQESVGVEDSVLRRAGARPADRDEVDWRVVNSVRLGIGRIIDSPHEVGGLPDLAENIRGERGIPPLNIPTSPNEIQPSGYTKLEEWLHAFNEDVERTPDLDWRSMISLDSLKGFLSIF